MPSTPTTSSVISSTSIRNEPLQCIRDQRAAYTRPPMTSQTFYVALATTVPHFSHHAKALEARMYKNAASLPLPLEIVPDKEIYEAFFPDGAEPDRRTPLGAAFLWWSALLRRNEYRTALAELSYNPPDWSDYAAAEAELAGWALAQNVIPSEDDEIAHLKFIPSPEWSSRAFAAAPLPNVQVLTVTLCHDGLWRVWGLSRNLIPTVQRVRYGED